MKKLLKVYGLTNEMEYYEMVAESRINGQITQAKEQFKAMPKENQKAMIKEMLTAYDQETAAFFIDQL